MAVSRTLAAARTKRKGAALQQKQQFHCKRQKVLEAERLLANPPAKYNKAWQGKAQKSHQALAEEKRTKCFFDYNGGFMEGSNCRFYTHH